MIRVRGMHKSYRTGKLVTPVLHGVDLDIERGDMVSIVGPSGSGKSTLMHAIGGLDRGYEGTIEVDGHDLHRMSDVELSTYRNEKVGFIFQTFNLLSHRTCAENVALPALFARGKEALAPAEALERARGVLERVDLADKVDALPTTLSGGQRQRVAIARALFNQPELMLCDEPTGNLDSAMGRTIMALFERLNEEDGITVLVVTHDPKIAAATRRTIRVQDGRVLEGSGVDAPPAPAEDVTGPDAPPVAADAPADVTADAPADAPAGETTGAPPATHAPPVAADAPQGVAPETPADPDPDPDEQQEARR